MQSFLAFQKSHALALRIRFLLGLGRYYLLLYKLIDPSPKWRSKIQISPNENRIPALESAPLL